MHHLRRQLHVKELLSYTFRIVVVVLLMITKCTFGVGVQLNVQDKYVVMDNGLVQVTFSNPGGSITGIGYNGTTNLLEVRNQEERRGYWDLNWSEARGGGQFDIIQGTKFKIILQTENQTEISFTRTWNSSQKGTLVPLNIDKRFIMLKDTHGFYTYSIYERSKEWPSFHLGNTRVVFKLKKDMFRYMAIDDNRQRRMPLPEDRSLQRAQPLDYKEAVRIVNPVEPIFEGEVDDKYQYSSKIENIKVHGWASINPPVGFWQITPSNEFRSGGPFKQELTSHVGPTSLTVFFSPHYIGEDVIPKFQTGEAWKKVFGPVFIYLNSGPLGVTTKTLWKDAVVQMKKQSEIWPYSFPVSDDFPKSEQRGSVHGRLLVRDRCIKELDIPADSAYVGLALPGEVGSWQTEAKGYQFWNKSSSRGFFLINNIRSGTYNLYASVPGFIGDYKSHKVVTIKPGDNIDLGNLIYTPPRTGPTLWQIGYPDRSAAEFFVPDPDSRYVNLLLRKNDKFRQYGLWEKYGVLYPDEDLVYTVNTSDYRKDWFYAHVTRKVGENSFKATTWNIKFKLTNVAQNQNYTLRLALASATFAELEVRFNDMNVKPPHFTTRLIGRSNAIARHGIHGTYWLFNIDVKSEWLVQGENVVFLTQSRTKGPFVGVMYDYLRLEGPSDVCYDLSR